MTSREWRFLRLMTIDVQNGRCASPECTAPARDVIIVDGAYRSFCRSCRLKRDGKSRARKGHHTRLVRLAQKSGQRSLLS